MDPVRFAVIGLGNMGAFHVGTFPNVRGAVLTAVCDPSPQKLQSICIGGSARPFENYQELFSANVSDAVLIATPHPQHPAIAMAALERGIHVLCEKPLAVSVTSARQVVDAAARRPNLKLAMMFQFRTLPIYRKLRELIADGELGEITRVTWIATDWFRTWAYYGSGGWRATWAGEGGGALVNQCPHNLDLMRWITGLNPARVTAVGFVGKSHPIEVEDEVSAIIEYDNGATGHFVTSTGEAPGTNHLEIVGDHGRLAVENGRILFTRTRRSVRQVRETDREAFAQVEAWDIDVPFAETDFESHTAITQNFIDAILKDEPLIASGQDGLAQVELASGILMSALQRRPVEFPVQAEQYDQFLQEMQRTYGGRKTLQVDPTATADIVSSFKQ